MNNRRVNVRAIIWLNNQLLAVKHKKDDGSPASYYATPGGGLDSHESLQDGLVREMREELGITPRVGKLLFIQQFNSDRGGFDEELEFFFHVENPEDFIDIDLSSTTHGAEEIALCEFISPSAERLLPAFLTETDIARHIAAPGSAEIFIDF